ncbi:hypothetical protein Agub_g13875, partial [Astrephomene gubernaculifera]
MGNKPSAESEGVACFHCIRPLPPNQYQFEHIGDQLYVFYETHSPSECYGVEFRDTASGLSDSVTGLCTLTRTLAYFRPGTEKPDEPYRYLCPGCFVKHAKPIQRRLANRICSPGGVPMIGFPFEDTSG